MDAKLNDKYVDSANKVCTINGLLIAQAICSRILMERYSTEVLEIMKRISTAIDNIKDSNE